MGIRSLASHHVLSFRARLGVEQFEDRVPVSESVGMGIGLRALANAAEIRAPRPTAPPPVRLDRASGTIALAETPTTALARPLPAPVAAPASSLTDTRSIAIYDPAPSEATL